MISSASRDRFIQQFQVPRETMDRLDAFVDLLVHGNAHQNLVASSTIPDIWDRHILDSAQLSKLAGPDTGDWLDVGSGAGLPGMVNSIINSASHVLLEPRRLRANFLAHVVDALDLRDRVTVVQSRVEAFVHQPFAIITARAFASLAETLRATLHLSDARTTWLLHKGRQAHAEIDVSAQSFRAEYESVVSASAADAFIVRCRNVVPHPTNRGS